MESLEKMKSKLSLEDSPCYAEEERGGEGALGGKSMHKVEWVGRRRPLGCTLHPRDQWRADLQLPEPQIWGRQWQGTRLKHRQRPGHVGPCGPRGLHPAGNWEPQSVYLATLKFPVDHLVDCVKGRGPKEKEKSCNDPNETRWITFAVEI